MFKFTTTREQDKQLERYKLLEEHFKKVVGEDFESWLGSIAKREAALEVKEMLLDKKIDAVETNAKALVIKEQAEHYSKIMVEVNEDYRGLMEKTIEAMRDLKQPSIIETGKATTNVTKT